MRQLRCASALVVIFAASVAHAQGGAGAGVGALLGLSIGLSIESSVQTTRANAHGGGMSDGLQSLKNCGDDDDCEHGEVCRVPWPGECPSGELCDGSQTKCVTRPEAGASTSAEADQPSPPESSPSPSTAPLPVPEASAPRRALCPVGSTCPVAEREKDLSPGAVPPSVSAQKCSSDEQCGPERTCQSGLCAAAPPPPPPSLPPSASRTSPSPLQRRGFEAYLRERAVPLREQLALGDGPLIVLLATTNGVKPTSLGRALRLHRAELCELISDDAHPQWTEEFLQRVEQLGRECAQG